MSTVHSLFGENQMSYQMKAAVAYVEALEMALELQDWQVFSDYS